MEHSMFYRNTWVEVDLDCIFDNVQNMKKHLPDQTEVMAVVKADGYGHHAESVARTALEAGATCLAVALLEEAVLLREVGLDVPILIMGWVDPKDLHVAIQYNLAVTAFQTEWFQQAKRLLGDKDQVSFHLKIDTGMGRLGLRSEDELSEILATIQGDKRFNFSGAFTHFATADELNNEYFNFQYGKFTKMLSIIRKLGFDPKVIHCGNSATSMRFPDKTFNAVRFGISMYGLSPSEEIKGELPFQLKQAFSLQSKITHVKKIAQGEKISYGATYEAEQDEWIGTIPIGYADGWIRKLKAADVLVDGQRAPIVGRICMDQCMIRLPKKVEIGTQVTLIGSQGDECIHMDEVARILDTINYEIPCTISYRIPRMILRKKRIMGVYHKFC